MISRSSDCSGARDRSNFRRPPQWAESLLVNVLNPRDRETIPGDLLEEYREERLPTLGYGRAYFWYIRQVVGIACVRPFEGGPMRSLLMGLCFFTLAATTWLGIMEIFLHRPGFVLRICIALLCSFQSLATILFLIFRDRGRLRILLGLGGGFIAIFGISVLVSILKAAHFEGYVLLIGSALILQGALTIGAFVHDSRLPC